MCSQLQQLTIRTSANLIELDQHHCKLNKHKGWRDYRNFSNIWDIAILYNTRTSQTNWPRENFFLFTILAIFNFQFWHVTRKYGVQLYQSKIQARTSFSFKKSTPGVRVHSSQPRLFLWLRTACATTSRSSSTLAFNWHMPTDKEKHSLNKDVTRCVDAEMQQVRNR